MNPSCSVTSACTYDVGQKTDGEIDQQSATEAIAWKSQDFLRQQGCVGRVGLVRAAVERRPVFGIVKTDADEDESEDIVETREDGPG